MDAPTITLSGFPVVLRQAPPLAGLALGRSREDFDASPPALVLALGAAALWVCWPPDKAWPARIPPRPWGVKEPIEHMGHAIFDSLGATIPAVPLMQACFAAWAWATSTTLGEAEVAAVQDFFEPPPGG